MEKTAAMIVTEMGDGSYLILDANGCTHQASSQEELGALCAAIVSDPTLPQYATQKAAAADLDEMMTKVAEIMLPERLGFLAAPGVGVAKKGLSAAKKAVNKLSVMTASPPVRKIQNTPESIAAGQERARLRREEKERLKAQARQAMEERERQRPRLRSVRT